MRLAGRLLTWGSESKLPSNFAKNEQKGRSPYPLGPHCYERGNEGVANVGTGNKTAPMTINATPATPQESCEHPNAFFTPLVSRTESGYLAYCPRCRTAGPVQESVGAARRALENLGRAI
jgi:hypothetical protein